MKRLVITGAKGTIGTVLTTKLNGYEIVPIDLPEFDLRHRNSLDEVLFESDTVLHLAWIPDELHRSGNDHKTNLQMAKNVLRASIDHGVSRLIFASSIHVHGVHPPSCNLVLRSHAPVPSSEYGQTKVAIENMLSDAARHPLDVIAIRFGGVNLNNTRPVDQLEKRRWLTHEDCVSLVKHCIEVPNIPNHFEVMYAVSDIPGRYHDFTNSIGWSPFEIAS